MKSNGWQSTLNLFLFDHLMIWYSIFMILLIIAFGRPLSSYFSSVVFYLSIITLVLVIARYLSAHRAGWRRFVRLLYPVFLFAFLYREAGDRIFLFFDGFLDSQLTTFEAAVFGFNPTLYVDRYLLNVPTTEILSLAYFLYYPLIPVYFIWAYLKKRFKLIWTSMAAVCAAFFMSYTLFLLYPIEGPRWFFADQYLSQIEGPLFRPIVDMVINRYAFHGGCMPSSHVAVAVVILLAVMSENKRVGWLVLLPLNIGLAAGTVWGRFHYVSDVIVGIAIALISWYVLRSYWPRYEKVAADKPADKDMRATYAS